MAKLGKEVSYKSYPMERLVASQDLTKPSICIIKHINPKKMVCLVNKSLDILKVVFASMENIKKLIIKKDNLKNSKLHGEDLIESRIRFSFPPRFLRLPFH